MLIKFGPSHWTQTIKIKVLGEYYTLQLLLHTICQNNDLDIEFLGWKVRDLDVFGMKKNLNKKVLPTQFT